MNRASHLRHAGRLRQKHRGMVLVSSLLLLVVVTILAMALFHSFGLDARSSGPCRPP